MKSLSKVLLRYDFLDTHAQIFDFSQYWNSTSHVVKFLNIKKKINKHDRIVQAKI